MSSLQPAMSMSMSMSTSSNAHLLFDERQWLNSIRRTLEEELETHTEIPVSIFNVPKTLISTDPDLYIPQEVAIGPYHYCRPELYEMERYKLGAAKRIQRELLNHSDLKFEDVVDQLIMLDLNIRACYHKFLNFSNETLVWMMAIGASFLLDVFQIYAVKEGKLSVSSSSIAMAHLVDYAGTKSLHNAILRDIIMLENQIPLFVLRKLLQVQNSSLESADDLLQAMLDGFCEEISPLKLMNNIHVSNAAHLLDFLYKMIVPKPGQPCTIIEVDDQIQITEENEQTSLQKNGQASSTDSYYVKKLFSELWKLLSKLDERPIRITKKVVFSKPVKVFVKLPWTLLSKLPGIQILAQPIQYLLFGQGNGEQSVSSNSSNDMNKAPLVEEITIPSVTELAKSQVQFSPANGDISTISFDTKSVTLYLPVVSLDINTEVVLRNLVAYEASNASGPLVFTRYTELMNGVIDTEEDVKLLREKGIILNRLKSDAEAAKLWNGMSKSLRLTKVPQIDKVIEDVNKYYNGLWKVKFGKYMRSYVYGSWKILIMLATVLLLVLTAFQAVCSVYTCGRVFHFNTMHAFDGMKDMQGSS